LRADHFLARVRREEVMALRFHGMWQGLAILLKTGSPVSPYSPPAPLRQPLCGDDEFIHLLANLVLHTESEFAHVC